MQTKEVLIVGAGPTGLVLALWLTRVGVKVRIIDKAEKAGTTSRAIVMHARNLEFYHQLGIADIAVKRGVEIKAGNFWVRGKKVGHVPLSDLESNISPYQYALGFPQDQQEEMLEEQLANLGVNVERNTELVSFVQWGNGVQAQLNKPNGEREQCNAMYLAGCDGARSMVRQQLGMDFPGGTYEETFYVADIQARGPIEQGEFNIALDDADFLAIFPIPGQAIRLVGTIRPEAMTKKNLKWEDISESIISRLKLEVEKVNWFSTYKVHHRVAAHFRKENVFLLGDAAHIHSPVGGQGMNTGIGDAVNLAWKLRVVLKDKAPVTILDTYEPERIAFARRLVATTDRAFTFVSKRGFIAKSIRIHIAPLLLPWLFGFVAVRRLLFCIISQTSINYRQSPLSVGKVGKTKGGDRLPWVKIDDGSDNFASLTTMKWQAHVYGNASDASNKLCDERGIKLNVFPWNEATNKAGLRRNSIYIIRPDGYVGMMEVGGDFEKVVGYLDKWGIGLK